MTFFESIKKIRERIATHDITFWEVVPAIAAMIIPNVFEPEWIWRLSALFVASVNLLYVSIHAILIPEQFSFPNVRPKNRKYFFWTAYLGSFAVLFFVLFFLLIPSGGDLYRVIQNPSGALERRILNTTEWGGGGSVAPFFIGQSLYAHDVVYYLPFSFKAWGVGTFEILYSTKTNIVYEIKSVK